MSDTRIANLERQMEALASHYRGTCDHIAFMSRLAALMDDKVQTQIGLLTQLTGLTAKAEEPFDIIPLMKESPSLRKIHDITAQIDALVAEYTTAMQDTVASSRANDAKASGQPAQEPAKKPDSPAGNAEIDPALIKAFVMDAETA